MYQKVITIDGESFFENDIKNMNKEQLKMFCSFLDEKQLSWVQKICNQNFAYIVDNILFKL